MAVDKDRPGNVLAPVGGTIGGQQQPVAGTESKFVDLGAAMHEVSVEDVARQALASEKMSPRAAANLEEIINGSQRNAEARLQGPLPQEPKVIVKPLTPAEISAALGQQLLEAISAGKIDTAISLASSKKIKPDFNQRDGDDRTPALAAAFHKRPEVLAAILEASPMSLRDKLPPMNGVAGPGLQEIAQYSGSETVQKVVRDATARHKASHGYHDGQPEEQKRLQAERDSALNAPSAQKISLDTPMSQIPDATLPSKHLGAIPAAGDPRKTPVSTSSQELLAQATPPAMRTTRPVTSP